MRTLLRLAFALAAPITFLAAALSPAHADDVAVYSFAGNSLSSSDTDPQSTASDIVIGTGLTGYTSFSATGATAPALVVTSDHTPATLADAVAQDAYVSGSVRTRGIASTGGRDSISACSVPTCKSLNFLAVTITRVSNEPTALL